MWMTVSQRTQFTFVLGLLALTRQVPAGAADVRVIVPTGWTPNPFFYTAAGENVAVALKPTAPPAQGGRVLQCRAGTVVYTDLPKEAFCLTYSPDGDYLLAYESLVSEGLSRVSLINSCGDVIWTKTDRREYNFSTTGQALYAWAGVDGPPDPVLEILDLSGTTIRTLAVDNKPIKAAVVFGSGDQAVVGFGSPERLVGLAPSSTSPGFTTTWGLRGPEEDWVPQLFISLGALDANRVIVQQGFGYFKVMNASGNVEYAYDPQVLGDNDPSRDPQDYANYKPSAGPTANELTLFNGSPMAFRLNLVSGQLQAWTIDTTIPPGFSLMGSIQANTLVLVGTSSIRIRRLGG